MSPWPFATYLDGVRLLHHRVRWAEPKRAWGEQVEVWVNHAGDRLFFRSNMAMQKGPHGLKWGNNLYLVKIPPRGREVTSNE